MMLRVARRDFEGMEQRRKRAAGMFARGATQADVARELEVSRQSVSRWYADWQRGGTTALKAAGAGGADAPFERGPARPGGPGAAPGATGPWVRHRSVDLGSGGG